MVTKSAEEKVTALEINTNENAEILTIGTSPIPFNIDVHLNQLLGEVRSSH